MDAHIAILPGDGIGPEVCSEAQQVLQVIASLFRHEFIMEQHDIGGIAIDHFGIPLPESTLTACIQTDAILLGAVGDPRWNDPSLPIRPEQGLLKLRQELGVFCNLRPVKIFPALQDRSPIKTAYLQNVDLLIVRELTGGLYFGKPRFREIIGEDERAVDTLEYTRSEIQRITELAFSFAQKRRKKLTSIDKANVLETSRLWRQVVSETAQRYPEVDLEHMLVDSAAMRIVNSPSQFDVVLTENMFGDILSDEASILSGSLGLLPSASIGNGKGLYEPIHGSAPDIAGQNIANPIGAILSAAMLLRYSLQLEAEANAIERSVEQTLSSGILSLDLGGSSKTNQITQSIIQFIRGA